MNTDDESRATSQAGDGTAVTVLPFVWRDGEVVAAEDATVSALDRTLLYGLGAFETVRIRSGRPFLFPRHIERLKRSLAAVNLPVPSGVGELAEAVVELAARNGGGDFVCRITVTAGREGGPTGAAPEQVMPGASGHVLAFLRRLPRRPADAPVRVGIANVTHDTRSPLAGIKSTNYLLHYMLRDEAERHGRVDDLMVDHEGRVTEATVSNVFVVHDGLLATPPVRQGILPGITRGLVLELAQALGIPTEERSVSVEEVRRADECFLTGSAKGVLSVDEIDGLPLGPDRPATRAIQVAFEARVRSECDRPGDGRAD